jgi:hypothetical protein
VRGSAAPGGDEGLVSLPPSEGRPAWPAHPGRPYRPLTGPPSRRRVGTRAGVRPDPRPPRGDHGDRRAAGEGGHPPGPVRGGPALDGYLGGRRVRHGPRPAGGLDPQRRPCRRGRHGGRGSGSPTGSAPPRSGWAPSPWRSRCPASRPPGRGAGVAARRHLRRCPHARRPTGPGPCHRPRRPARTGVQQPPDHPPPSILPPTQARPPTTGPPASPASSPGGATGPPTSTARRSRRPSLT